jgi:hypothetical protein
MAIQYPVTVPSYAEIESFTMMRQNRVGISESPFTFEQQIYQHQGQRWECTVETHPLTRGSIEDWRGFLASLQGTYGTFLMGDPIGQSALGSAGGSPKVSVASQTGVELPFYDGEVSVNSYLLLGDYIQIGSSSSATLHRITQKVTTGGGATGTMDIWPRITVVPDSGTPIYVNSTVGVWRLVEGTESEVYYTPNNISVSFTAVQAIPTT